ncbi:Protein C15orf41-like protein [Picochlorum sp. SENEW3]|nr:Protein C15orf41-like protein [Picochlorum sp. SENEW3]
MNEKTYQSILETLASVPVTAMPCVKLLGDRFGVGAETVHSIYSQEVQYRVKKTHTALCEASVGLMKEYVLGDKSIIDLCLQWHMPPSIMVRRMLESCPSLGCKNGKVVGSVLKNADMLRTCVTPGFLDALIETDLNAHGIAYHQTEDQFLDRLVADIETCAIMDSICGPAADAARHGAGEDYETRLYDHLQEHKICFWTENDLRDQHFHKTPDALLKVPIAVCGKVVCWIDSKATFCDAKTHRKLLQEQYDSYVNRFGPGLVIYWHGYLESVQLMDFVTVMDHFPCGKDEIIRLPMLDADSI